MNVTPRTPVWYLLSRHWLSLLGAGLVTTAVISWLFVLPQHLRGHNDNPYVGIVIFFALPAVFFIGLLLIPIGVYLSKRRIHAEATGQRSIGGPRSDESPGSSASPRC